MLVANVTDIATTEELEQVMKAAHDYNASFIDDEEAHELTVTFSNEDDAKGFDITVCDLGHDVEWS